ncbi:hypothetical protein E6C27_scaffold61G002780 [Cucumis melo var. makuwa]|uniref:Uncharacterized protein n=1 Tax=Cucumis melo var. makuwa TaxID=1194695 RepID=A0A5A7U314_CUCMM|nr:hypothetical protein E6C27_scaffold61G002780 [Cucumis melo var. makuwa]
MPCPTGSPVWHGYRYDSSDSTGSLQPDYLSVSSGYATDQFVLGVPLGHRRPDFVSTGAHVARVRNVPVIGGRDKSKGKLASDQKKRCRHVEVHVKGVVGEAEELDVPSQRSNLLCRQPTLTHRHPGGSRRNGAALSGHATGCSSPFPRGPADPGRPCSGLDRPSSSPCGSSAQAGSTVG